MNAAEQLRPLCYGGEELLETASVDGGVIGITSHRVLALRPAGPGPRFHTIERPNVTGFSTRSTGPQSHRYRAIVAGVIGIGLLAVGAAIGAVGPDQSVDAPVVEGLGGLFGLILELLDLFDEALRLLGLLALVAALGFTAWYLWKAGWVIEITIAGDDSVRIPIARDQMAAADRLESALADARVDDPPDSTATAPG